MMIEMDDKDGGRGLVVEAGGVRWSGEGAENLGTGTLACGHMTQHLQRGIRRATIL